MKAKESFTRLASRSLSLLLAAAMSVSGLPVTAYAGGLDNVNAANISRGDTASALPDVKSICDAVESSQNGTFATKPGSFMGTSADCAGKPRRQRETPECKVDLGTGLAGLTGDTLQSRIDSLCAQSSGLSHDSAVYCALRSATKGGQALQYCNAYMSSDKAQNGLKKTLFFDIAAAGTCYGEYIAIILSKGSKTPYKGYACGGAAMAASLMELVQTVSVLGKSKDAYGDGSSGDRSAGGYKIDSSNRVVNRGGLAKALEITMSTTLSASAFYMGLCYYNKDKSNGLCGQFSQSKNTKISEAQKRANHSTQADRTAAQKSNNDTVSNGTRGRYIGSALTGKDMTTDSDKESAQRWAENRKAIDDKMDQANKAADELNAQAQIALRTAMIFTALAGMRGIASSTAGKTKKDAEDILQSLFTSNGGTTAFGGSGTGGYQASSYLAATTNSFNSTTSDGSNRSASTAAAADPSDSAFLAPPGGALNQKASAIGTALASSAKGGGDMGSAAGLGAGIAAAASAAGAPASALGEIRGHVDSVFANLPKEGGGYGGSSGGGLAKKSDGGGSGMDGLNLKGLFGGGEKEERAAGNESLAYRGLASDDIWHSQNPKGNNLFQIISDRYDTAQRKQDLAP